MSRAVIDGGDAEVCHVNRILCLRRFSFLRRSQIFVDGLELGVVHERLQISSRVPFSFLGPYIEVDVSV